VWCLAAGVVVAMRGSTLRLERLEMPTTVTTDLPGGVESA